MLKPTLPQEEWDLLYLMRDLLKDINLREANEHTQRLLRDLSRHGLVCEVEGRPGRLQLSREGLMATALHRRGRRPSRLGHVLHNPVTATLLLGVCGGALVGLPLGQALDGAAAGAMLAGLFAAAGTLA